MRLRLGDRTYELATRPLVLGVVGDGAEAVKDADAMIVDGADLLEVHAGHEQELQAHVDVPVATRWHAEVAGVGESRIVTHVGPATVEAVRDHLVECARKFEAAGTPSDCIVVDPGLDRHKTEDQRVELLRRTEDLATLGYPLLMTCESAAEAALAVTHGCRIVRTHDVRAMRRACDVIAAILEAE